MDRDEALKLLQGGPDGVAEWNRRRSAGESIPDLCNVSLAKSSLRGARLDEVNLNGADLRWADLKGAKFRDAKLAGADFRWAHLDGADLRGASMRGARLREAKLEAKLFKTDLREADLRGANLCGADLREADLGGSRCLKTIFADVDLSEAKGLESVKHEGPSTLGTDTILRSRGKISEAFLRGCGVPEQWIEYLPSLVGAMSPIQFYSCFISHSSKDEEFAQRLHARLVQARLRVWFAPEDMRGGRKSIDQIDQAIRVHDKLLLVLSEASMSSDWVKHEVVKAVAREKAEKRQVLFPISLVGFNAIKEWTAFDSDLGRDLAKVVREYHVPDFSKWKKHDAFEAGFKKLLRDLNREAAIPS
jgi:hypothetical protein